MQGVCQSYKALVTCLRRQSSCSPQARVIQLRCASEEAAELPQSTWPCGPQGWAQGCSTAPAPVLIYLPGIHGELLIGSWFLRETLPLLSPAAARAHRLLLHPGGLRPCCHGGNITSPSRAGTVGPSYQHNLLDQGNLGRKIPVLFSLLFCPWPLGLFLSQLHFNQLSLLPLALQAICPKPWPPPWEVEGKHHTIRQRQIPQYSLCWKPSHPTSKHCLPIMGHAPAPHLPFV